MKKGPNPTYEHHKDFIQQAGNKFTRTKGSTMTKVKTDPCNEIIHSLGFGIIKLIPLDVLFDEKNELFDDSVLTLNIQVGSRLSIFK